MLKAVREMLREQGVQVGWMDASTGFPPEFDERWSAVVMDDVHQYTPMQQARAFNWFVNAINPPSGSPVLDFVRRRCAARRDGGA